MTDYKEVSTTQHEQGREQRVTTFKLTQLIWLLLGLLEALLALRVLFKLIGVNAANPFANFIYNLSELFVAPFVSLIGAPAAGGMVLEISSIIAMIVYLLVGWALERIVYVIFYRPRGPVSVKQTIVEDHIAQPAPISRNQTITTDRTTTQTPSSSSSTTVTESTHDQTPDSL
jgi:uncharacterized protein YggT (Ycf19 family)